MSNQPTYPDLASDDRRNLLRHEFYVDVICRPVDAGPEEAQRARVCDVSVDGLSLLIAKRCRYGDVLLVELVDTPFSIAGTLMVRVRNVREAGDGHFILGCRFICHPQGGDMSAAFRIKLSRPSGSEQRSLPRYPFVVPISCRATASGRNAVWSGTTLDLSPGGVRLTGELRLPADTLVTIKLASEFGKSHSLTGRIKNTRGVDGIWEFGCAFPGQLTPEELQALLRDAWTQGSAKRMAEADSVAKLKLALADQIEHDRLSDARQTVISILRLEPGDQDALVARSFLQATPLLSETKRFEGHKSCVNAVVFSGGSRFAISGSGVEKLVYPNEPDNSLRFWDITNGIQTHLYTGHAFPIISIAMARESELGLTASRCGTLHLWDMEQRRVIRRFDTQGKDVNCVALSASGKLAISGHDDGMLRLWDADIGQCIQRVQAHDRSLTSCVFLPGDGAVLTGSADRTVRILSLAPPFRQQVLRGHLRDVTSVACSPDGLRLASASVDGTIRIWTGASDKSVCLTGHNEAVHAVAFSPDGKCLLSGSADNSVRLWDTARGYEFACLASHTAPVKCVAFSPDGRHALSGGADNTVRFWDLPKRG
jgi:WD40 repeat protein